MKLKLLALFTGAILLLSSCSGGGDKYGKYNLKDYIDPGDYTNLTLTEDDIDKAVQNEINALLNANSTSTVVAGRGVEEGDIVNIDYEGYMDGELFQGGSDTGYDLVIGSGEFIPGFEEGLIGAKQGETVEVNLNFPDEYKVNPNFAGKAAMFKVKINSISIAVNPELNDEFIASIYPEYPTVATYKDALRENVRLSLLWELASQKAIILQYPSDEVSAYAADMNMQFTAMASSYGMTLEGLLTGYYQMSVDDFNAQAIQYAQAQVAAEMLVYAIAEKEEIKLDDDTYNEIALQIALSNDITTVKELEDIYGVENVRVSALRKLVMERLDEIYSANTSVDAKAEETIG